MDRKNDDGTAATLRAALVIVIAGALLGLGFNHLGLASKPPHGLAWIKRAPAKLPSLEDLQPATPAPAPDGPASVVPGGSPGAVMVLAVSAPRGLVSLQATTATGSAPATTTTTTKKKATAKRKPAAKPAPAAAAPAAPAPAKPGNTAVVPKVDLPVVPDMDTPIEVKLAFAKRFFDADGAVFVDAREPGEYAEGHIRGAVSVPFDRAAADPGLLAPFKKAGKPIIAYCSGGDCETSHNLATNMLAEGIRKVLVFTDGYPAWKAAGYPVETGPGPKR